MAPETRCCRRGTFSFQQDFEELRAGLIHGAAWLGSVRIEHVLEEFLPAVLCSLFALWSPDGLS